jgi:hypothetical protein
VPDYALVSIDRGCINRGNLIIQRATQHVLALSDSTFEINAYSRIGAKTLKKLNVSKALILPGATLLEPGDHLAMKDLSAVKIPILAVGVCLRSELDLVDLSVAQNIKLPIGSRDPFTHRALRAHGLESHLVGCQTLFLGRASGWLERDGPILFCPGLGDGRVQNECLRACAVVGPTIVLSHAPDVECFEFDNSNPKVVPLAGAEQAISLISSASVVVTCRIHALLLCLAFGTPAVFLGGWYDSRYSLLELLGVSVEPPIPRRIQRILERVRSGKCPPEYCFQVADNLRASMREFLDRVAQPLGLHPNV